MSVKSFYNLLDKVKPLIEKQETLLRPSINAEIRLLLTCRFLATGETYASLSFNFRISIPSISSIIPETLKAIYETLKKDYLKMPSTEVEWVKIASDFERNWNFPLCVGALDGKHIAISGKKEYGSLYFNYKGFHSIVLMALVDANYRFLCVDVGANGRANDAAVFNQSNLCKGISTNAFNFPADEQLLMISRKLPYVIVADDAFRLSTRIMKPFGHRSPHEHNIFNYRLSRARRVVENAFGILANKFRVLQKEINLSIEKAELITLTACVLRNYIINENGFNTKQVDHENITSITMANGSWRKSVFITNLERQRGNRSANEGMDIRNTFMEYFNTEGAVSWQKEAITKFNF